eukprot:2546301-Rhodomonas_salina.1
MKLDRVLLLVSETTEGKRKEKEKRKARALRLGPTRLGSDSEALKPAARAQALTLGFQVVPVGPGEAQVTGTPRCSPPDSESLWPCHC